jgi:hypothetical protein
VENAGDQTEPGKRKAIINYFFIENMQLLHYADILSAVF